MKIFSLKNINFFVNSLNYTKARDLETTKVQFGLKDKVSLALKLTYQNNNKYLTVFNFIDVALGLLSEFPNSTENLDYYDFYIDGLDITNQRPSQMGFFDMFDIKRKSYIITSVGFAVEKNFTYSDFQNLKIGIKSDKNNVEFDFKNEFNKRISLSTGALSLDVYVNIPDIKMCQTFINNMNRSFGGKGIWQALIGNNIGTDHVLTINKIFLINKNKDDLLIILRQLHDQAIEFVQDMVLNNK